MFSVLRLIHMSAFCIMLSFLCVSEFPSGVTSVFLMSVFNADLQGIVFMLVIILPSYIGMILWVSVIHACMCSCVGTGPMLMSSVFLDRSSLYLLRQDLR